VNYVPPVAGTDKALAKIDPNVAKNPLIIPPPSVLKNAHQFDPNAVNNQEFRKQFQALMG
jgi:spermidine/putrescine transport system substrate-binding protein